jgi:hypothetical protein
MNHKKTIKALLKSEEKAYKDLVKSENKVKKISLKLERVYREAYLLEIALERAESEYLKASEKFCTVI